MVDKTNWQHQGGSLEIPDGWVVYSANFDAEEPYIVIFPSSGQNDHENKIMVPKALAYYLSTHYCGSEAMENVLRSRGRMEIQNKIKDALGIENDRDRS